MDANQDVNLTELYQYQDYLRTHGRKGITVDSILFPIRKMLRMLQDAGRPTAMADLSVDDVVWLATNLHVKDSVKTEYLRLFSRMCIFHTGKDLWAQADVPINRPIIDRTFITLDEFEIMYAAAKPNIRLALALGAFMGLRRFEICNLNDSDIHGNRITVHGKGHGDGLIVDMEIPELVQTAIDEFRAYKRTHGKDSGDGALFQLIDTHQVWHRCHTNTLSAKIKELGESCGIVATTHSLRRLYATTLANDVGCDFNTLRILMRHADVSTTLRCYVDPDPRKQKAATSELMGIMKQRVHH